MTRRDLERLCAKGAHWWPVDELTVGCTMLGSRTIYADARDKAVTPWLKQVGIWEPWISTAFLNALRPGDRVLDVGANVGWYSMLAHWAQAEVVGAVEASPRLCELLRRTFAENGIDAHLFPLAAWDKTGETLMLEQSGEDFGGMSVKADRWERLPVQSTRLDDLGLEAIDVLKIDVEGAEMEVWRGARKLLQHPGIRVFMEFTPVSQGSRDDALAALREIENDGFAIQVVAGDGSVEAGNVEGLAVMPDWLMLYLERRVTAAGHPEELRQEPDVTGSVEVTRQAPDLKLLWIGDAVIQSGFARVCHNVVPQLIDHGWEVAVLGVNYRGDPHPYPYRIYPSIAGGDLIGYGRYREMLTLEQPDVVLVNQDTWLTIPFTVILEDAKLVAPPIVGYMPIDGPALKLATGKDLNRLDRAIFYTQFGYETATASGFKGEPHTIPHGVDRRVYRPMNRSEARLKSGLAKVFPRDAFIFGCVNRNQPRKRLDLTVELFARWLVAHPEWRESTYLYLHCASDDYGWDLRHLARFYGVTDRVGAAKMDLFSGADESLMPAVYCSLDALVSTSLGEGWGLPHIEAMACGVPQLLPDHSALSEWAAKAALMVPIGSHQAFSGRETNCVGGVVDSRAFIEGLELLRCDDDRRAALSEAGLHLVAEPRYDWRTIGARFDQELRDVVGRRAARAA